MLGGGEGGGLVDKTVGESDGAGGEVFDRLLLFPRDGEPYDPPDEDLLLWELLFTTLLLFEADAAEDKEEELLLVAGRGGVLSVDDVRSCRRSYSASGFSAEQHSLSESMFIAMERWSISLCVSEAWDEGRLLCSP